MEDRFNVFVNSHMKTFSSYDEAVEYGKSKIVKENWKTVVHIWKNFQVAIAVVTDDANGITVHDLTK